jgi:hypothetical protein
LTIFEQPLALNRKILIYLGKNNFYPIYDKFDSQIEVIHPITKTKAMKTRKVPTALENYELLKLSRIQSFNMRAFKWVKRGVFVVILVIVIVLQMLISKAESIVVPAQMNTQYSNSGSF